METLQETLLLVRYISLDIRLKSLRKGVDKDGLAKLTQLEKEQSAVLEEILPYIHLTSLFDSHD